MGKQKMIQIKNFRAKFTEPDDEGHFTGYASVFELEDLDGDIIKPGAFKKTLAEKKRFPFLWQHMVQEPIGWVEMEEDEKGLKITNGKLILDVQRAAEARALMKEGAINGLSIGFEYVKWENIDGGNGKIVTEIKLWEVSAVTFPAQPAAMIETVKTLDISKLSTDDDIGDVEGKDMNQDNLDLKSVIPYHDYGNADEDAEWDAGKEVREADVETLKKICAWYDSENPDIKTSYKLPHHRAADLKAVWRGVAAAMAALLGARGGVDIPEADRKGVYNHLAKHYKDFEKEPPEFSSVEPPEPEKTTRDTEPEKTTQNGKIDVPLKDNEKEKEKMEKEELERKELKEKVEVLEKQILELKAAGFKGLDLKDEKAKKYEEKFWEYMRTGVEPPELKVASDFLTEPIATSPGAQGGYLIPQKLFSKIIEKVLDYSPIRKYAFTTTVAGDIDIIKEGAGIEVIWPGEGQEFSQTTGSGNLLIPKKLVQHPQSALVRVSRKMLAQDTIVNLEDFIAGLVGRYMAQSEATKFIKGNGTASPYGLLASDGTPIVQRVITGTASGLTLDNLKKLYYSVPSYARSRGVWCMNDEIMLLLSQIKTAVTTGTSPTENVKWNSYAFGDIIGPEPNTILGRPVISCPEMDNSTDSSKEPVAFGDLQGYWITDNPNVFVLRLDEAYATKGQVGFLFEFLKGGYPVDPQGLRVLKCSAS